MIIYGIQNTVTDKWYIGKTTKPVNERFSEHSRSLIKNKHTNCHLQSAFNKYGKEAFEYIPLGLARHQIELNELEQVFISYYDSFQNGYNLTTGGDGGWTHREETKQKQAEASRGNQYAKGYKHTEEYKQQQSKRHIGKVVSKVTRKKLSDLQTKRWSNGTENIQGNKNPFYGKTHSQETLEKLKLVNLGKKYKKVRCYICNKSVARNTINRYHNSNCKFQQETNNVIV